MAADLVPWLAAACEELADSSDELTELDAAAGDGDLGVTVRAGAHGVAAALRGLEPASTPSDVARAAGAAFARGNPSTFAALTGSGLLALAEALKGITAPSRPDVVRALTKAADRISERGGAILGDCTVLDALLPAVEALDGVEGDTPVALRAMVRAAEAGVAETTTLMRAKGRGSWVANRALGVPDGGATALLRFLEALLRRREELAAPG
jgi:dihydroxyacetone kinase